MGLLDILRFFKRSYEKFSTIFCQKAEVSRREGHEDPLTGAGQCWKDNDPEEPRQRRHLNDHSDAGLQHQVRPDVRLQAERVGYWGAEEDQTLLEELL